MSGRQTGSFRAKQPCNDLFATKHEAPSTNIRFTLICLSAGSRIESTAFQRPSTEQPFLRYFQVARPLARAWIFKARAPRSSCPPPSPGLAPSSVAPASTQSTAACAAPTTADHHSSTDRPRPTVDAELRAPASHPVSPLASATSTALATHQPASCRDRSSPALGTSQGPLRAQATLVDTRRPRHRNRSSLVAHIHHGLQRINKRPGTPRRGLAMGQFAEHVSPPQPDRLQHCDRRPPELAFPLALAVALKQRPKRR